VNENIHPAAHFECLPVAVRAWLHPRPATEPDGSSMEPWSPSEPARPSPHRVLVFDTETTTDRTQRLLYGVWRLYRDRAASGSTCVEEGIFYADDLPERDPVGFALLRAYARAKPASVADGWSKRIRLVSRSEFVNRVLWKHGYERQATIVGFNLPFDLARLAVRATRAKGRNAGGISLVLWQRADGSENKFRPRVILRPIDGQRTLISFNSTRDNAHIYRGRFLDLRTAAFAHTSDKLSLESACAAFGIRFTKADVEHGTISPEHVDYCRADVAATAELYRAIHAEHRRHPIDLPVERAFSGATLGKAYWKAMGIKPTAERLGEIPAEVFGWGMEAFYGGRSECRIRNLEVPVVYVDFLSMYMTCNALMGTWGLITADHLSLDDCTAEIAELLDADDLAGRCFDPATWKRLHVLVQVDPNGATLPVRARYDTASDDYGIGINPYRSDRAQWYPLADLIAARLLDGPTPTVLRAFRFTPHGQATGLSTVRLAGEIEINPLRDDFFAATVEQRARTRRNRNLSPEGRNRTQRALKVLGNATGYGIFAELHPDRIDEPEEHSIHAGDGTPIPHTTDRPEKPGAYCFPPLAATITGAARLMLALLEHDVTAAGGTFAFCDTDSMAIVATKRGGLIECPGGPWRTDDGSPAVKALTWRQVQAIVDRFGALNPYDRDAVAGSILEIEAENYVDGSRRRRQLHCFAISAKRYQLTTDGHNVKPSEHGLGHLHPPAEGWIEQVWEWIQDLSCPAPDWFALPAVSKITVSGPDAYHWFTLINRGKPYSEHVKPQNFILSAYADPLDLAAQDRPQLVAPYNSDPDTWRNLSWFDRRTGTRTRVRTTALDGCHRPGTIRVLSYGDVIGRYAAHPEAKALGPDGEPVTSRTVGLLKRRAVRAVQPVQFIGKESNDLDARSSGVADDEHITTYNPADEDWHQLVVPTLAAIDTTEIAAATGVDLRTVQRAIARHCTPRPEARWRLIEVATAHARRNCDANLRSDRRTALYQFLSLRFAQKPW
jgi:hypothetical protein